jgi:serine protease
MFTPQPGSGRAVSRRLVGLASLTLTIGLAVSRAGSAPLAAGSPPSSVSRSANVVPVLIGFRPPAYVLSAAARGQILSRASERARIAGLRGMVGRQFGCADTVAALVPGETINALRHDPTVAFVEEDRPVRMLQLDPAVDAPQLPALPELVPWGVGGDDQTAGVRATQAGADGEGVSVGVLDTGVGPHPDLEVAGGYNFVANTEEYADDVGHGTHVAGTIAASQNGIGLVGIAPKVQLYALKVLNERGTGRTSNIIAGLQWAIDHHLQVLNMSFGSSQSSQAEQRAIQAAAHAGIVMVAASGNEGTSVSYPAAYPEVIAVGAVDRRGVLAPFSNRGPRLGFVAPGVNILSTVPEDRGFTLSAAIRDGSSSELDAAGIRFSAATTAEGVSGPVRFAGRGSETDVAALDLKGAIALMERGDIPFSDKVAHAAAAGAVGALIFNNQPGSYAGTLGSPGAIPALALSREAGLTLKDDSSTPVRLIVTRNAAYTRFSGTSMASPHVAGVAALVLSVRSDLDPAGLRLILKQTATDLGAKGRDDLYGDGLVNATAAVKAARGLPTIP